MNTTTFNSRLSSIRLVLTDVDGVLTDGSLIYGPQGELLKIFNVQDGVAVHQLRNAGITLGVVSGRDSEALRARLKDLGITNFNLNCKNKKEAVKSILAQTHIAREHCIFLGDDLPDLPAFAACGLSACPCNAAPEVLQKADIVLKRAGGEGVLRELTELILQARNN